MSTTPFSSADLLAVIERHWGYRSLRPLQERAMLAMLEGRDSIVVLPTGGGKSLCYQAPAVLKGGTTVVVSPLISLMKDQVDGLRACGISAAQFDSSLSATKRYAYETDILQGAVNLLFVSPERLAMDEFCRLLERVDVKAFAIDEAHCISHWGHDFRPEYRLLGRLKTQFPKASVHAFTATATEQVCRDVCLQLKLRQPEVLVGNFDRPNLNYRVLPRHNEFAQVREVLDRHKNEPGIIYCIRRRDVDDLAARLNDAGYPCLPYHAGMTREQRTDVQEQFASEKCDIIVATVAFGMGIDRSNVRFVLHTAMPKSIEHYQQETGRAGRDGLEAECALLFSGADVMLWKRLIEMAARDEPVDPQYRAAAQKHLDDMDRYCRGTLCRHRALVQYFGQAYEPAQCGACDVCLGDSEPVPDADVIAQKILSCVARVKEGFGVSHVVAILRGENTDRIRSRQHDQLSTFGLLKEHSKEALRDWIYQLVGQGALVQAGDEFPVLKLTEASWEVMRKQRSVRLRRPVERAQRPTRKTRAEVASWEGVDQGLFEKLRKVRQGLAKLKQLPPYIIFNDKSLRELARIRPASEATMQLVPGIGANKLAEYGPHVLPAIAQYCKAHDLAQDVDVKPSPKTSPTAAPARPTPARATPSGTPLSEHEATIIAQKILSCVARLGEPYRLGQVSRILRGKLNRPIQELGHDRLSTFGLLKDHAREQVSAWILALIEQQVLVGDGTYNPLLSLNDASRAVMRGQRSVRLTGGTSTEKDARFANPSDEDLFEVLSQKCEELAAAAGIKPASIFQERTLRELVLFKPSTPAKMRLIIGVGEGKMASYGVAFFDELDRFCQERSLPRDQPGTPPRNPAPLRKTKLDPEEQAQAFALFAEHKTLDEVQLAAGLSRDKVIDYLGDFVRAGHGTLDPWVPAELQERISAAAQKVGADRLKPVFLELGEKVSYDYIRLVLARQPRACG